MSTPKLSSAPAMTYMLVAEQTWNDAQTDQALRAALQRQLDEKLLSETGITVFERVGSIHAMPAGDSRPGWMVIQQRYTV